MKQFSECSVTLSGLPNIPSAPIIIWSCYAVVAIWFLLALRSKDVITNHVKVIASIGIMYSFLLLYGSMCGIFPLAKAPHGTETYLIIGKVILNEFIIFFIPALVISPLLIAIFQRNVILASIIVVFPTFCIRVFGDFSTLNRACLTIGRNSAASLGLFGAIYLASILLLRFLKLGQSNTGVDTDAAKPAAQVTP